MPSPFVNLILDFATETTLALVRTAVDAINTKIPADPSTVTAQTAGNNSLASLDGKVTECDTGAIAGTVAISGTPTVSATQGTAAAVGAPWYVRLSDGAAAVAVALDSTLVAMSAKLPATLGVKAAAASLSVTQSTEDAAKVPVLGQALAGSSVPVVLTAIQVAQLAQAAQLPSALGTTSPALSLSVTPSVMRSTGVVATLATTGVQIKATPGQAYYVVWTNSTGGAVFLQWYDTSSTPSAGDSPIWYSGSIASGNISAGAQGHLTEGITCPNTGIFFILSSTQATYTAIASNAFKYVVYYR